MPYHFCVFFCRRHDRDTFHYFCLPSAPLSSDHSSLFLHSTPPCSTSHPSLSSTEPFRSGLRLPSEHLEGKWEIFTHKLKKFSDCQTLSPIFHKLPICQKILQQPSRTRKF